MPDSEQTVDYAELARQQAEAAVAPREKQEKGDAEPSARDRHKVATNDELYAEVGAAMLALIESRKVLAPELDVILDPTTNPRDLLRTFTLAKRDSVAQHEALKAAHGAFLAVVNRLKAEKKAEKKAA